MRVPTVGLVVEREVLLAVGTYNDVVSLRWLPSWLVTLGLVVGDVELTSRWLSADALALRVWDFPLDQRSSLGEITATPFPPE